MSYVMLPNGYAMALIQSKAGATGGEDGAGPVTTETDCNRDVPEAQMAAAIASHPAQRGIWCAVPVNPRPTL